MEKNRDLDERAGKHDPGAAERPSEPKAIEKTGQTSDPERAELSDEELGNVSGGMNKHLSTCTY